MSRIGRLVPIIGGAVAGGAIALVVASGGGSTHTVTTRPSRSRRAQTPRCRPR